MSTQTQTRTIELAGTDLDVLVGEIEQLPCELTQHGKHPIHTDQPASHYIRTHCPDCGDDSGVVPACPGFVAAVRANLHGLCRECHAEHAALDVVTILSPVLS